MAGIYEHDVLKASQLLEAELIGKGSSLASELHSATFSSSSSTSSEPLHSFDSGTEDDPFESLKGQLEELNSAVCETKSLHHKLCNTLSLDNSLGIVGGYAPPLELLVTSVVGLIDKKSKDRERQTTWLKTIDGSIRSHWMTIDLIKELEQVTVNLINTLHDGTYSYANPLPVLRCLSTETTAATQSMDELKELMLVNKHQVQELNVRLRAIAKTVHDVRKDTTRLSRIFQPDEVDDQRQTLLEKGQVEQKVKEILCGLDELDVKYSVKLFLST